MEIILDKMHAHFEAERERIAQEPSLQVGADFRRREQAIKVEADKVLQKAINVGLATGMPWSIPFALLTIPVEQYYLLQWRLELAMRIAVIQGYTLDEHTYSMGILPATVGMTTADLMKELSAQFGVRFLAKILRRTILRKFPARFLRAINQIFGMRLLAVTGKSWITVSKALPFLGSVVGAWLNHREITGCISAARQNFPYNDVFFSHDWGTDANNTNHTRVRTIVEMLRSFGLRVWFDEDEMRTGNLVTACTSGITDSKGFLFGITNNYKLRLEQPGSYCRTELDHALRTVPNNYFIPVLLESNVDLTGRLQQFQDHLRYDLSPIEIDPQEVRALAEGIAQALHIPRVLQNLGLAETAEDVHESDDDSDFVE